MLLAPRAMFVLRVHNRWVFRCGAEIEARKILLFHLPLPPLPVWRVSQKKEEDSSVDHQPPPKFDALYISYPSLLRNVLGTEAGPIHMRIGLLPVHLRIPPYLFPYPSWYGGIQMDNRGFSPLRLKNLGPRPSAKTFLREGKECLSMILAGHSRSKRGMRRKRRERICQFWIYHSVLPLQNSAFALFCCALAKVSEKSEHSCALHDVRCPYQEGPRR